MCSSETFYDSEIRNSCLVDLLCRFDEDKNKFISLEELKLMMEKLGAPQTHLALKNMMKEVDEDQDSQMNFREVSLRFTRQLKGRRYSCENENG